MAHPTVNSLAAALVAATAAAAVATAALDAPAAASPPPPDLITVGGGTSGCTLAARLCAGLPDAHITLLGRGAPRNATEDLHVRAPRNTGATWAAPSLTAPFSLTPNPGLGGRPVTLLTGTTLSAARRRSMGRSGPSRPPPWRASGGWRASTRRPHRPTMRGRGIPCAAVPPPHIQHIYIEDWLDAAAAAGLPRVDGSPGGGAATVPRLAAAGHHTQRPPHGRVYRLRAAGAGRRVGVQSPCHPGGDRYQAGLPTRGTGRQSADRGVGRRVGAVGRGGNDGDMRTTHAVGSPQRPCRGGSLGNGALTTRFRHWSPCCAPQRGHSASGRPPRRREGAGARSLGVLVGGYTGVPLAPINNTTALVIPATLAQWRAGRGGLLATSATVGLSWTTAGGGGYVSASFAALGAPPGSRLFFAAFLTNPESFGHLRVANANASVAAAPVVETNLLGDAADVATLLACMRQRQAVLSSFRPALNLAWWPRCRHPTHYVRPASFIAQTPRRSCLHRRFRRGRRPY